MIKLENKMASEAVLKYLVDTNRPYSCADVTVNLRGAYTKTVVQKTLDSLVESGKIRCKLYGKQKVYAAVQPDNQEADSDVEDYDTQFKNLTQHLTEKLNDIKSAESTLKSLLSAPTTSSAKSQIAETKSKMVAMDVKLTTLRNSTEVVSVEEKTAILNEHEKLLREYRQRKRISSDMLDAILEGYPKTKKTLLDELCIETDEMADFKLMSST